MNFPAGFFTILKFSIAVFGVGIARYRKAFAGNEIK